MSTRRERILVDARAAAGRALGPLAEARHGRFYAWRRAVAHELARVSALGSVTDLDLVRAAEIPGRVPGAAVHEAAPAAVERLPLPRVHTRRAWLASVLPLPSPLSLPALQVVDVPDGVLYGYEGTFGIDATSIVDMASVTSTADGVVASIADGARARGRTVLRGTTVSLLQSVASNHAHWLLQGIPRLALVERFVDLATVDRVLVNEGAPESVYVACERIGVDPQIVVPVPKSTGLVQCERLVSATPVHRYAVLSDWSRTWIAARFPVTEPGSVRRLFVGRGNATRRRTVNFDAIRAMVESRGFVTVAMDGRSVDEQAAWFAGADVIVIEHGAALANLAFARPGTRVVELVGANTVSWMYAIGSGRAGLEYDMLLGTEPTPPRSLWSWQLDADQVVDVERLGQLLDRIDARG